MRSRWFGVWLLVVLGTLIGSSAPAAERPNVLWLIAEDFGPHLGCYGTQQVHTPRLDALASAGMRYTRAYSTAPVCSASRSAFMTGMYQTTIGAHNHRSHRKDGYRLPEGVRTLPDWFRSAGYFAANLKELPEPVGFKGSGKTDWNFNIDGPAFDSNRWADLKSHQPFVAQLNFQETHRTFHAPKHADPDKVAIPPYYPDHPVTRQDMAAYLDAATELDRKVGRVLDQLKTDGLADSTIVIFMADHGEAHIRGKQFCYEEGLHVPLIVYCPPTVTAPEGYQPGTVSDRFVELIDIGPTILSLAGAERPASMQGQAFLGRNQPPARTRAFGARDRCDETVFRFRTVRDDRYRYIRNFTPDRPFLQDNAYKARQYPVWNLLKELHAEGKLTPEQAVLCAPTMPAEELYDLTTDPHQILNLAESKDPEHQAARARLSQELEEWITTTKDQGAYPETPESARK